jgi:hypothetical protein
MRSLRTLDPVDDQRSASLEKARDTLAGQLLDRLDVVMIDIGRDESRGRPVLRVHVRRSADDLTGIPLEVEGIPVQVLSGDYRLERPDA